MPIYEEQCRLCGHNFEYISFKFTEETKPCPLCGAGSDRIPSVCAGTVFEGYDTRNISPDGKSMHIGSKGDLTRACHEFGVVPAGDAIPPRTRFTPIEREVPKW